MSSTLLGLVEKNTIIGIIILEMVKMDKKKAESLK
jgi:hypothetical protein